MDLWMNAYVNKKTDGDKQIDREMKTSQTLTSSINSKKIVSKEETEAQNS